jgi:flagellar biogenesis protein FliO
LDRDCELQKIAVFDGYLQAGVNAQYAFLAGGLIGVLILVLTLFYEGVFDFLGGRLFGIAPLAVVLALVFYTNYLLLKAINRQQIRHLSLAFDLISQVEKGEPIPSLDELEMKVNQKNAR